MTRAAYLLVVLALTLSACMVQASPSSWPSSAPATPPASASAAASTTVAAGRPYTGDDVLAAMRDSRRPGGVPDSLETADIAGAVADQLWTWDGEAWAAMTIGGACGASSCSLEVSGTPSEADGTDQYTFSVRPDTGTVELKDANLQGLPAGVSAELDSIVREHLVSGELDGLALVATSWLLPAADDRYRLAYRSGGEEGSAGLDVVVDRATASIVSTDPVG